jgi:hypothetical protein
MGNNRRHYKVEGTKNKRAIKKSIKDKSLKVPSSGRKFILSENEYTKNYNVSWHAIKRFAERILNIEPKELNKNKAIMIAKNIRDTLPKHLINEAKYNLIDNFYAVVNGGVVVTVVKVGR